VGRVQHPGVKEFAMNVIYSNTLAGTRRRPLAVCLASIFSLSAPAAFAANTWYVDTCSEGISNTDATHGSLRWAIAPAQAQDGDTIDMTAIGCSTISLTTGEIFVPQPSLTITGPGASALTVDATGNPGGTHGPFTSRVFTHMGLGGTLTVQSLTLAGGHAVRSGYAALGGCIYSAGNVTLKNASVTGCYTYESGTYGSYGGGVYTKGNLYIRYSTLTNNNANAADTEGVGDGVGGGAFVRGRIGVTYSTISGNTAKSRAGGVYVNGDAGFFASTISGNSADSFAGIDAYTYPNPSGNIFSLGNSTVSGNTATNQAGAMYANSGTVRFYNSTVAFNSAPAVPGVSVGSFYGAVNVRLESTLMSNNSDGSTDRDLFIFPNGPDPLNPNPITINNGELALPANNLIRTANAALPADTKVSCPQLGPLRNNGGLTQTHALGSTSPAIDSGNTLAGPGVGNYEQRGAAEVNGVRDYTRTSRPIDSVDPPVADIGAYEVQQDDEIFQTFFDGCNPVPG
jgi:hypothetical protein